MISRPTERTNDAGPDGLADRHARSSTAEQPDKVEDLDWSDRSRQRTSEELVEQDSQDMMDISRSSAEEGEITNNSAQDMSDSTLARKTEHGIRSEEVVNGPADAISLSQPSRQSSRSSALSVEDDYAPDPAQLTPAYEASHTAEDQRPSEEPTAAGETQKKSPSRILADSSGKSNSSDEPDGSEDSDDSTDVPDSDNYEPPEPLSPANVKEADTTHPPVGPVSLDTNVEAEKRADDPAPSAVENPAPVALSQGAQPIEAIHNIEVSKIIYPNLACSCLDRMRYRNHRKERDISYPTRVR